MTKEEILKEAIIKFGMDEGNMKRQEAVLDYNDMLGDGEINGLFTAIYEAMEIYKNAK